MRTDVKLGIVTSMVVVLVAGGYFLFRGDSQAPIPIADNASPTAPKPWQHLQKSAATYPQFSMNDN